MAKHKEDYGKCYHYAVVEFRDKKTGSILHDESSPRKYAIKYFEEEHEYSGSCDEKDNQLRTAVLGFLHFLTEKNNRAIIYNIVAFDRLSSFLKQRYER